VRITQQRVLDLPDLERGNVVGGEALQGGERGGPFDLELAHVTDVEAAHGRAHRAMLLDDAAVLHRHLPATERDHARAGPNVRSVERRALQRGVHERFSRPSPLGVVKANGGAARTLTTTDLGG
jgi:hypothetical protein